MSNFKIAAAQVASVRGDIERNIATHAQAIATAAEHKVSVLIFPELSLTGYEPDLAAELAITPADSRLSELSKLARERQINVVLGAPLANGTTKPYLGAILLQSDGSLRTYRKMHLGSNEQPIFSPGDVPCVMATHDHTIGIAICADTGQASHPQTYADAGATIYAAGVFLNAEWYAIDSQRFPTYATRHGLLTVMANHGASVGSFTSVGHSAIWTPDGALLVSAVGTESTLVIATRSKSSWSGELIKL